MSETWFVSRSAVESGRRCARFRWLSVHAEAEIDSDSGLKVLGGYGRGLRPEAVSLPLVTGTHVHSIFAALLQYQQRFEEQEARHVAAIHDHSWWCATAYEAIEKVVSEYKAQTAPFLELVGQVADSEAARLQEETVKEQAWLVECLGWVLALRVIPTLLTDWEVVEVETEHDHVLAGNITFMVRPDAVLRHRRTRRLAVLDLKTSADITSKMFTAQWATSPQLNSCCRAIAVALGEACEDYYVMALQKGRRVPDLDYGKQTGPDKQQSPFCYAFLREMPMEGQEWRPSYYVEVVDEVTGESKREGSTEKRGWHKVKVWEHAASARAYVEQLPQNFIDGSVRFIGPIASKDRLIDSYFAGIEGEEQRWQALAQEMYGIDTFPWENVEFKHSRFREALDRNAPQSWSCWSYGRECEFRGVCLGVPGALDRFAPRVPHHESERLAIEAVFGTGGVREETDGE